MPLPVYPAALPARKSGVRPDERPRPILPSHAAEKVAGCNVPTVSGREINLLGPQPEDINFYDIAEALAKQARFNGHTPNTCYSVAQHCVLVADALPPAHRLAGLLHDAQEAYMGDITRPVKEAMKALKCDYGLRRVADLLDEAIFAAAGLTWPPPIATMDAVHDMDRRVLATELRDLMASQFGLARGSYSPLPVRIKPQPWPKAAEEWLDRFYRYRTEIKPTAAGAL